MNRNQAWLIALTLGVGIAATPAAAQVRVVVDGKVQDVPDGVIRTISYQPGGRQIIHDQPFAGRIAPGAATVTTTETVDEDENGTVLRTYVVTRIEPMIAAYAQPFGRSSSAPSPMPAIYMQPNQPSFAQEPAWDQSAEPFDADPAESSADPAAPDADQATLDTDPAMLDTDLTALDAEATPLDAAPLDVAAAPLDTEAARFDAQAAPVALADAAVALPGADAQTVRVKRDTTTGHFITTVRINGVPVRAIVDTGAQSTILSTRDARATGAGDDIVRTQPMAGIGGYTLLNVARIRSLEVGGQQLGGFTAAIGQEGIPYTLLGQTEIARLGRIVIEDGVMTITPRGQRLASR